MKLNKNILPDLEKSRNRIAAALKKYEANNRSTVKMRADEETLGAEIAALEASTDYTDAKSLAALATKKDQLSLLRQRLPNLEVSAAPDIENIRVSLQDVQEPLARFVTPEIESLKVDIARELLPSHGAWSTALVAAERSPKMDSFTRFFCRHNWHVTGDYVVNARKAVSIVDALLGGNNPWSFSVESEGTEAASQII